MAKEYYFTYTRAKLTARLKDRRLIMAPLDPFRSGAVIWGRTRNEEIVPMPRITDTYEHYYARCLKAEQFVVNTSGFSDSELDDVQGTYFNLLKAGLHYYPCNDFIVHLIHDPEKQERQLLHSILALNMLDPDGHWDKEGGKSTRFQVLLCTPDEWDFCNSPVNMGNLEVVVIALRALLALLATKGVFKEKCGVLPSPKDQPAMRRILSHGSPCYTYIRRPTAQELDASCSGTVRPHFRRGHIRRLEPENPATSEVWVSPCFVNGEPEVQRLAYIV